MNKLAQLRLLFVLYMVAKTIVEIVLGSGICLESLGGGRASWLLHVLGSPIALSIMTIFSNFILLVLGLLVFHFLLQKKNRARIFLLVIGWINVIDALLGIVFRSEVTRFVSSVTFGIDWDRILLLDRVTDALGLIYWGYAIVVLQFTNSVREEFFAPPAASVPNQTE